jgi:hypothetical protein
MPEPFTDMLATVAAGRSALVARLRAIAARVEELPLDAAAGGGDVRATRSAGARTRTRRPRLSAAAPRALLEPPCAACQAFAVVVVTDHLAALAVEDHHGRGAAPALPTQPAEGEGR